MAGKWIITPRQRCDLEMLLNGGFKPLNGFLGQGDYRGVLTEMRLENGQLWPMPITLDVTEDFARCVNLNDIVELYDPDNTLLARMTVTDKWQPDKVAEARCVFGTQDVKHPGVNFLFNKAGSWYLGGPVEAVQLPKHFDFIELRRTPDALKRLFNQLGWKKIIGFQTRNPIHRAHLELTLRAAEMHEGHVLLHPVVGMTKPGDVDYFTRVRCYQKILRYYPKQKAELSLLPLAMRMGGPKEALWHALIRKNYGCTHFIVGRDHAGPGNNAQGKPFYDPYAAQDLVGQYQEEAGIHMVPFQEMVYVKERKQYSPSDQLLPHETALSVSGTELRNCLMTGKTIPDWFSFPEIIKELRASYPAKHHQGFTLFFTGLSGSGKTTLAQALMAQLMSLGKRNITLLDGDVMRRILAGELGFSKEHRDLNIRRIGFVAAEITKAGGAVLCAAIAPYAGARMESRQMISQYGGFIEIYISTPFSICAKRDTKGLYAKAMKGEIKGFTGFDDPYEAPENPEITLDTANMGVDEAVEKIITYLHQEGYLLLPEVHEKLEKEAEPFLIPEPQLA